MSAIGWIADMRPAQRRTLLRYGLGVGRTPEVKFYPPSRHDQGKSKPVFGKPEDQGSRTQQIRGGFGMIETHDPPYRGQS